MVLVEHWWNRQWGWARRDIRVYRDGDVWTVVGQERQAEVVRYVDLTEVEVPEVVDHLIRHTPGPRSNWRKLGR